MTLQSINDKIFYRETLKAPWSVQMKKMNSSYTASFHGECSRVQRRDRLLYLPELATLEIGLKRIGHNKNETNIIVIVVVICLHNVWMIFCSNFFSLKNVRLTAVACQIVLC